MRSQGVARLVLALPVVGTLLVAVVLLVQAHSLPLLLVGLPAVVVAGLLIVALVRRRAMVPELSEGGTAPYLSLIFGGSRPSDADVHASLDPVPPAQRSPRPERPYRPPRQ